MATIHRDTLQKQTQQDWANREYIEIITSSIKKITDFLNSFGKHFISLICGLFDMVICLLKTCRAVVVWLD